MKRIIVLLLAALLLISLSACLSFRDNDDQPVGEGIQTKEILFDFSNGSPEENIVSITHYSYQDITVNDIIDALSSMSGLNFDVTLSEVEGRNVADWSAASTLIAGLGDRSQKEDFHFDDADSMRWFMMDSLWRALGSVEIYYTMDGGNELAFDELYPVNIFPSDLPYMGSAFYFAHSDVVGDFSYVDTEYQLVLHYPNSFAPEGEMDESGSGIMRFPSHQDNSVLQYWVIENTYGDTIDSFAETVPVDGISIYNNALIGWGNDLNQLTGEETPTAYYWVVEQDWIACVAIGCETQEQTIMWCDAMISDHAVFIDRLEQEAGDSGIGEDEAMDILVGSLDMQEGTAVVFYGGEYIDGVHCWTFAYGRNTPEKFTAETHYAVTDDGSILVYDFASNKYKEFEAP